MKTKQTGVFSIFLIRTFFSSLFIRTLSDNEVKVTGGLSECPIDENALSHKIALQHFSSLKLGYCFCCFLFILLLFWLFLVDVVVVFCCFCLCCCSCWWYILVVVLCCFHVVVKDWFKKCNVVSQLFFPTSETFSWKTKKVWLFAHWLLTF